MSIYKVPMGVLNIMEYTRRNFFNGVDNKERKTSMIGWKKILASKKKGRLDVSSFFALNRALLFNGYGGSSLKACPLVLFYKGYLW